MPQPTAPFSHQGDTAAMIWLSLKNLLLNLLTLSLWRFWGKTRVRRLLWDRTFAWGDAAEYTGTGGELFLGFIIVMVAVFTPVMVAFGALQILVESGNMWAAPGILVLQLFVIFLAGAGLYRARRYQMTRTRWRGIRGGQAGAAWQYGLMMLGVGVVTALTLGWGWPWAEMKLARYRMDNTTFGSGSFSCDAVARPLYKRFAVLWFCGVAFLVGIAGAGAAIAQTISRPEDSIAIIVVSYVAMLAWAALTLALPYAWYRAGFYRQLAAHTRFGDIAFTLEATTGSLILLALGNGLISLLSLGILRPVVALRTFRYGCDRLRAFGEPDWHAISQSAESAPRLGEGLAAVFDGAGEF